MKHSNSNQQASFGELAELASQQAVPEEVFLKDPDEFQFIGKKLSRKDNSDKITGKAIYEVRRILLEHMRAIDAQDRVYVAENSSVVVLDLQGNHLGSIGGLALPGPIAVGPTGRLYVRTISPVGIQVYDGFGAGNFRALFESIEEDQIQRGVLKEAEDA